MTYRKLISFIQENLRHVSKNTVSPQHLSQELFSSPSPEQYDRSSALISFCHKGGGPSSPSSQSRATVSLQVKQISNMSHPTQLHVAKVRFQTGETERMRIEADFPIPSPLQGRKTVPDWTQSSQAFKQIKKKNVNNKIKI